MEDLKRVLGEDAKEPVFEGSALQMASFSGCKKAVQMLIDAGADVNALGPFGRGSALQAALRQGHRYRVAIARRPDSGNEILNEQRYEDWSEIADAYDEVAQVLSYAGATCEEIILSWWRE